MLTYVIVLVAVVAVLYGSFRALGGGDPVPADDYRTVLRRIAAFTEERATELAVAIEAPPVAGPAPAPDPLTEAAGGARKRLAGYQQQLARLEPDAGGDEHEVLQSARSLLSAAIEDLGWACRMVEQGTFRDNFGVQRAVAALRDHGTECLQAATRLVG